MMKVTVGHGVQWKDTCRGIDLHCKVEMFKKSKGSSNLSSNSEHFKLNRNKMSDLPEENTL